MVFPASSNAIMKNHKTYFRKHAIGIQETMNIDKEQMKRIIKISKKNGGDTIENSGSM
jgi:hypothetical protein